MQKGGKLYIGIDDDGNVTGIHNYNKLMNDLGIRHSIIGYKSNDIGQLLENIIYLELLRRGYKVNVGVMGEKEIDFIAVNKRKRLLKAI